MRDAAPACSLARALARKPRQRRNTRGEKHKERREEPEQSTRRHHEANVARASRASRLRVWWVACSPCSRAARARRAFEVGAFRVRSCVLSVLPGSLPARFIEHASRNPTKRKHNNANRRRTAAKTKTKLAARMRRNMHRTSSEKWHSLKEDQC